MPLSCFIIPVFINKHPNSSIIPTSYSSELTRLWSICADNKAACQAEDRMYLPTLKDFFQDAYDQEDPVNQIEDQYKYENVLLLEKVQIFLIISCNYP